MMPRLLAAVSEDPALLDWLRNKHETPAVSPDLIAASVSYVVRASGPTQCATQAGAGALADPGPPKSPRPEFVQAEGHPRGLCKVRPENKVAPNRATAHRSGSLDSSETWGLQNDHEITKAVLADRVIPGDGSGCPADAELPLQPNAARNNSPLTDSYDANAGVLPHDLDRTVHNQAVSVGIPSTSGDSDSQYQKRIGVDSPKSGAQMSKEFPQLQTICTSNANGRTQGDRNLSDGSSGDDGQRLAPDGTSRQDRSVQDVVPLNGVHLNEGTGTCVSKAEGVEEQSSLNLGRFVRPACDTPVRGGAANASSFRAGRVLDETKCNNYLPQTEELRSIEGSQLKNVGPGQEGGLSDLRDLDSKAQGLTPAQHGQSDGSSYMPDEALADPPMDTKSLFVPLFRRGRYVLGQLYGRVSPNSLALAMLNAGKVPVQVARRFVIDLAIDNCIEFLEYEWFQDGTLVVSVHHISFEGNYEGTSVVLASDGENDHTAGHSQAAMPTRVVMRMRFSERFDCMCCDGRRSTPECLAQQARLLPSSKPGSVSWTHWTTAFARTRTGSSTNTVEITAKTPIGDLSMSQQFRLEQRVNTSFRSDATGVREEFVTSLFREYMNPVRDQALVREFMLDALYDDSKEVLHDNGTESLSPPTQLSASDRQYQKHDRVSFAESPNTRTGHSENTPVGSVGACDDKGGSAAHAGARTRSNRAGPGPVRKEFRCECGLLFMHRGHYNAHQRAVHLKYVSGRTT